MTTTKQPNKAQRRKERLEKHYELCAQLGAITGSKLSGKKISTELFKLEQMAHAGATAFNNGEEFAIYAQTPNRFNFHTDENAWDSFKSVMASRLKEVLGSIPKGFFVNGDSRGYALKLEENSIDLPLHTDWGRYQILSPDLNNE